MFAAWVPLLKTDTNFLS